LRNRKNNFRSFTYGKETTTARRLAVMAEALAERERERERERVYRERTAH